MQSVFRTMSNIYNWCENTYPLDRIPNTSLKLFIKPLNYFFEVAFFGRAQCFSLSQQLPPETCSIKTVFFKISQNAQKNKRFPVNFLRTNKKEERGTKRKFLRTAIPYKTSVFLPSKKCTNYLFFSQVIKFPRMGYVLYFKNFLFLPKQISA